MDSVTNSGLRQTKRVEEAAAEETAIICWTWNPHDHNHSLPQKKCHGSCYTGAAGVSGIHDLMSHYHRPDGENIQVPEIDWEDQIPAFSTWRTTQFLLKSNDEATFWTSCALTLRAPQSSAEAEAKVWMMTESWFRKKWCFETPVSSAEM